jgi:hypothetical protein
VPSNDTGRAWYVITCLDLRLFRLLIILIATILLKHNILDKPLMNYDNYEQKVAERWGAMLLGWPLKKIVNPAKAGTRQDLDRLHRALKGGECTWGMLNAEELEERITTNHAREEAGEEVYKRRKVAISKGAKSRDCIESDDNEMTQGTQEHKQGETP